MDRQPGLAKMKIELHVKGCVTTNQFTRLQLLIAYCKTTTICNDDFILQFANLPVLVRGNQILYPSLFHAWFFFFIKIK